MTQKISVNKFPAKIIKLSNGLTVIHHYIATTPVVVTDVWVRAGAIKEPEQWYGIAHFLEHTIFKGTEKIGPGEFDMIIENRGGVTNAATSHDYAHFFMTTAAQYIDDTVSALGELLLNAMIPDQELIRERDVVLEEIRQTYDNPDWLGFQYLLENIYQYHPYRRPVLGTEDSVMCLSADDLRNFHRYHYQPANMTVVIVGGIKEDQAVKCVERYFKDFSTPPNFCPVGKVKKEPPINEMRRQKIYLPRLEQSRLSLGWSCPGVENLRVAYGLDLLSVLLGEGRTSRLVWDLREERQLVQGISSGFSLQKDSSLFTISVSLEQEDLPKVEEIIVNYLWDLQKNPISEIELQKCQRLLCNDYAFSTETPGQLASLYGYYNTIATADLSIIYPEQIKSFTVEELQILANKYLSPEFYAATIMVNSV